MLTYPNTYYRGYLSIVPKAIVIAAEASATPSAQEKQVQIRSIMLAVLVGASGAGPVIADDVVIPMPEGIKAQRLKASYVCSGVGALTAEYVNAGDISLALLPVDGKPLVFANVLSASGARYAAGPYVWWTKGNSASLYDLRKGENAAPVTCEEKQ